MEIVYMVYPHAEEGETRKENLALALAWRNRLQEMDEARAILVPWMADCLYPSGPGFPWNANARAFRRRETVWMIGEAGWSVALCGPRVTDGMREAISFCKAQIYDFTSVFWQARLRGDDRPADAFGAARVRYRAGFLHEGIDTIGEFRNADRWLSNFWEEGFKWAGMRWPSAEHAYQAWKADDPAEAERIRRARTPGQARRMGRAARHIEGMEGRKIGAMREILEAKFSVPRLRMLLRATSGKMLVEGNRWGDRFWGVCGGEGENHLGRLLMEIRDAM